MSRNAGPLATFAFAAALAAVLGTLVAVASTALAPRIAENRELERKTHVLVATGLVPADARPTGERVEQLYASRVVEKRMRLGERERPFFVALDARGQPAALCIPVAGPGLWGPIRGYLAVDAAARRIVGVTFYEHRETPGLGDAIAQPRWTEQWRGKAIVDDDGHLVPVRVQKGGIDPNSAWHAAHAVDAISGATVTSRAVESLVSDGLRDYLPILEAQWRSR